MSALSSKLAKIASENKAAQRSNKFMQGDFSAVKNVKNTGEVYSATQAIADSTNSALRLTFDGKNWK